MSISKPDFPKAPEYAALAKQTADSGRYNVVTPTGTSTWTIPAFGIATNTQALSGPQQTIFNQRQGIEQSGLDAASPILRSPIIDQSKLVEAPVRPGMTAQNAIMARLQPELQRQRDAIHTQLTNWGLTPGSEAYQQGMRQQSERENDLLTQAVLQGIGLDTQARQQGINEQQQFINTPLSALNAMRSGKQVASPGLGQPIDYLSAANNQYQAAVDAYGLGAGKNQQTWQSIADILATHLPLRLSP